MTTSDDSFDKELAAVKVVYEALLPLGETGRQWVLNTATKRLGITFSETTTDGARLAHGSSSESKSHGTSTGSGGVSSADGQTAKQFIKSKQPNTELQRITCLAYYLTHNKKLTEFKTSDLTKLNDEAGGEALSNPSMIVANATRQSKFLAPSKTGKKRLTARGEELVEALPNQEAVKTTLAKLRKPRKKHKKNSAAKAK